MEYSYADLDRKFRDTTILASEITASITLPPAYYHISGFATDDDDIAKACATKYPLTGADAKWFYVPTYARNTTKNPRLRIYYWNPESGIYHGSAPGDLFLVLRRTRKSFSVGLNNNSYMIHRYLGGQVLDPVTASSVDPSKPRLFRNTDILSEKIYRVGSSIFFNSQRIGLVQEQKIYLSDPDYQYFLPENLRELCIQSL